MSSVSWLSLDSNMHHEYYQAIEIDLDQCAQYGAMSPRTAPDRARDARDSCVKEPLGPCATLAKAGSAEW